jgi:hypothetical protein
MAKGVIHKFLDWMYSKSFYGKPVKTLLSDKSEETRKK